MSGLDSFLTQRLIGISLKKNLSAAKLQSKDSLTQRLMGISMWSKDKKKGHKEYGITPTSTFYPRILHTLLNHKT